MTEDELIYKITKLNKFLSPESNVIIHDAGIR